MRLAWFRATALEHASSLDATAALIAELRSTHALDVFTRVNAHDFVWQHVRAPYDVPVFELDNRSSHAFIWPYLLHFSGVLLLSAPTLHDSRAQALLAEGRRDDYAAEFLFNEGHLPPRARVPPWLRLGTWPMLRVPLMAARVTVVPHAGLAGVLREQFPEARVVYAPLGIQGRQAVPQRQPAAVLTVGVLATDRVDAAVRALARARAGGAQALLMVDRSPERVLQEADVVLALSWPWHGEPQQLALAALAAGKPVVAIETALTADWPALDAQTWRPRGLPTEPAIAITVDLRDEEHSLALAMRRLAADASLRSRLGDAARTWAHAHESVDAAVGAWQRLLQEAARLDPPPRPADWLPHLTADGTEAARAMLAEFGVTLDLF